MSLSLYLRFAVLLIALDATILTYYYSALLSSELVPSYILGRALLDLVLISSNLSKLKLTPLELFLIISLVGYGIIGSLVLPSLNLSYSSSRALNDTLWPIAFIMKVAVFRAALRLNDLTADNIRKLTVWLVFLAITQISIFVYFSSGTGAYPGVTPPLNLPLALSIATNSPYSMVTFVLLIALTGKRSFLISALIAITLYIFLKKKNNTLTLIMVAMPLMLAALLSDYIIESIGFKLVLSYVQLLELGGGFIGNFPANLSVEEKSALYLATGGRSEEILAIISAMSPLSYLTGLGAGFTYTFSHPELEVENYANAHFSPLALIYKFGIVYCIIIYSYIFRNMFSSMVDGTVRSGFIGFFLFLTMMQSFFAFNLFAEMLLPILVAMSQISSEFSRLARRS